MAHDSALKPQESHFLSRLSKAGRSPRGAERVLLVLILLAATGIGFAGIKKSLPYTPEVDEGNFVRRAVNIAATGDLNPGWFGHPGSTVIYPLAAAYSAWHALTEGGNIIPPDETIRQNFDEDTDDFYYLGRGLTILYFIGAVLATYLIGRRAFNPTIALAGALFIAVNLLLLEHAQIVRTDSAGVFFGGMALWLILRVHDGPTIMARLLAGGAIGLAVSSRYFLVMLVPVLAVAELLVLARAWRSADRSLTVRDFAGPLIGPAAALAVFAITTPYFFLDFSTARQTIQDEARATHPGADGLRKSGNFLWYWTSAIPRAVTWPVALLAAAGAAITLFRRQEAPVLLLLFTGIFVTAISFSSLHWQRWIIPVLPVVVLFAGLALYEAIAFARSRVGLTHAAALGVTGVAVLLLAAWPAYDVVIHDIQEARPSTNLLAREWILDNLPEDARIAGELYTAPLQGTNLRYSQSFSLFTNRTLEDYEREGVRYIVTSSNMYGRFYAEPGRYAEVVERYDHLFNDRDLLREFEPGRTRGGPTIRIYEISPQEGELTGTEARSQPAP